MEVIFELARHRYKRVLATTVVIEPGLLEVRAVCPPDIDAGVHKIGIINKTETSETLIKSTLWAPSTIIAAGSEFTLRVEFPKEMFTIINEPVNKSLLKTVYNNVCKILRRKQYETRN
jgi:hypothetical protein